MPEYFSSGYLIFFYPFIVTEYGNRDTLQSSGGNTMQFRRNKPMGIKNKPGGVNPAFPKLKAHLN